MATESEKATEIVMATATIIRFIKAHWILITIIVLAILVRLISLSFPYGDYDEGVYIGTIRSLLHGFPLYGQTYDTQGPLFFYLAALFYLISPTLESVRLVPVISSLVIVYLAFRITDRQVGRVAAVFAGLYLALDTYFLTISRTFQIDIPWLAFSFISFYFLLSYQENAKQINIILSAVFFALSLLLKLNPIFAAVIGCYFLINWYLHGWRTLQNAWYFVVIPAVLFIIFIPWKDWSAFYASSVAVRTTHLSLLHLSQWLSFPRSLLLRHERFILMIDAITLLAVIRLAYVSKKTLRDWLAKNVFIVLSLLWLVITVIVFDYYNPLFPHHFVFLILPAVLVASWLIQLTYNKIKLLGQTVTLLYAIIIGLIIFYGAWEGTKLVSVLRPQPSSYNKVQLQAADYLRNHTGANDYVVTDDQLVAYLANRNLIPGLVDTSFVTIQTNGLTSARAIAETQQYRPTAVVLISGRLSLLTGYIQYLNTNYPQVTHSNGATIYQKSSVSN